MIFPSVNPITRRHQFLRAGVPAVLLTLLALASCIKPSAEAPAVASASERIIVSVQNNHRADVTIYIVADGQARRIGVATVAQTTNFDVPARSLGQGRQVRLRADPIGGRDVHTSEVVGIGPGQRLRWTLETDLSRSTLAVY